MQQIFKKIAHVGVVVKDLYETLANYTEKYGIGPWSVYNCNPDNVGELLTGGEKKRSSFLLAVCFLDDLGIELIQPLDKNNIYYDFLSKYGENLHHIGYETEDYDQTIEYLESKGLKVSMSGNFFGGNQFSYIDSLGTIKHIAEFSKAEPGYFQKETGKFGISWLTNPAPSSIYPLPEKQKTMIEPVFSKLGQVAFIVKNIDETVKKLTDEFGFGPWKIWNFGPEVVADMTVHGKKQDHRMGVAITQIGDIDFEIIQPNDNASLYSEYLENYGEGFHHVAYIVKDFNKTMQYMKKLSLEVSTSGTWAEKHSWAYLTTEDDLKHIAELNDTDPDFLQPKPEATYP